LTKKEWKDVMKVEIDGLEKYNTWEIVGKPKQKNISGSKCIITVKYKAGGYIERYKMR